MCANISTKLYLIMVLEDKSRDSPHLLELLLKGTCMSAPNLMAIHQIILLRGNIMEWRQNGREVKGSPKESGDCHLGNINGCTKLLANPSSRNISLVE